MLDKIQEFFENGNWNYETTILTLVAGLIFVFLDRRFFRYKLKKSSLIELKQREYLAFISCVSHLSVLSKEDEKGKVNSEYSDTLNEFMRRFFQLRGYASNHVVNMSFEVFDLINREVSQDRIAISLSKTVNAIREDMFELNFESKIHTNS